MNKRNRSTIISVATLVAAATPNIAAFLEASSRASPVSTKSSVEEKL